jgi:hypothetical protein
LLVWTVPSPSSRYKTYFVRVSAIQSLHLPLLLYKSFGLARDYRASGFPEFDRLRMEVSLHAALFNSLLST